MSYVDGFVAAVPTANREAFIDHAEAMAAIFKKFGALEIAECWGDDVPDGKLTSFPLAVQKREDETIVFSWIVWPSKQIRDEAWAKVMANPPEMQGTPPLPFDGKRMILGGFEQVVEA